MIKKRDLKPLTVYAWDPVQKKLVPEHELTRTLEAESISDMKAFVESMPEGTVASIELKVNLRGA